MLNIDNLNWIEIDKKNEETTLDGVRYVRPISLKSMPHECPSCKILICTAEDIDSMDKESVCQDCYLRFYYINKEKWEKGWRPKNVNR